MRINCLFYMTVEEYYKSITGVNINHKTIKKAMIEFAKYHVEKALEEASYKAKAFNKSKFPGDINPQVDMDSILNAYTLENIK